MLLFRRINKTQKYKKNKSAIHSVKKLFVSRHRTIKSQSKHGNITMTKNKKPDCPPPMTIITECSAYVEWSQTKNLDNSTHRAWRPPVPDEEGCGTHRGLLIPDGETKHYGYCLNHGWQPVTGKEKDRFVHTSKKCT